MSYVLIVDDDHNVAQTLSDMVGLFDWSTQLVTSPRAAIELLQRNPPALILLDLNMPGVDGLEVCRYIKRDPIAGSTPVVFVTAEDDPGTKERATAAGAMDYLVKPVDIDRLEQVLDRIPSKPGKQDTSSTGKNPAAQPGGTSTIKLPAAIKSTAPPAPAVVPASPAVPDPVQPPAPASPPVPPSAPSPALVQPAPVPAKPQEPPSPAVASPAGQAAQTPAKPAGAGSPAPVTSAPTDKPNAKPS